MWGAGPQCRAVPHGATRCHAVPRVLGTHLGTIGRCSAPGWPASVGACGSGEGGGTVGTRGCTPNPAPLPLIPCPQDLAQPRSLSPWPRAAGGPVGMRGAEPCAGTQVAFKSTSPPHGANDNQELIMAMAWGQRGQHRGPALPRPPPACPCPRSPGASPGGSCPTPLGGTWGGGLVAPRVALVAQGGVAVAAGCPP